MAVSATRRKMIGRAKTLLEQAQAIIEEAAAGEQASFDEMSERAQESDRGIAMADAASTLEENAALIEDIMASLDEATQP